MFDIILPAAEQANAIFRVWVALSLWNTSPLSKEEEEEKHGRYYKESIAVNLFRFSLEYFPTFKLQKSITKIQLFFVKAIQCNHETFQVNISIVKHKLLGFQLN